MYNRFLKNDKGFTGLEAAIVLIAFVVVAAVFSYVMLGAGFYTTQKSQEVVHTGVTQASSSLAPSGDIIVSSTTNGEANLVTFYVTNTAGGTAVDLDKTVLTYTDNNDFLTKAYSSDGAAAHLGPGNGDQGWKYSTVIVENNDNLLEKGEKYKVVINLATLGATEPGINEGIRIQLKPPEGATLTIERTMPAVLEAGSFYSVY
jgi:archaeal flagellin FlaB